MRIAVPGVLVLLSLMPGCFLCPLLCPVPDSEWFQPRWETPGQGYKTFVQALEEGAWQVVYESLSPGFKAKWGVPDTRTFSQGYQYYRSDLDELAVLLRQAEFAGITERTEGDRHFAILSLLHGESRGEFILMDQPGWEVTARIGGHDSPDTHRFFLPGRDFGGRLFVKDGFLYIGPLPIGEKLGILDATEVLRVELSHRWLLEDVRELVNAEELLGVFGALVVPEKE